jgi:cell division protease FtsH
MTVVLSLLPWILILGFMWFFIFRQIRNVGAGGGVLGNFGRSRHRVSSKEHTNVTFADVAGIQEAQEEVQEIIEFLRNPKRFQRLGGRIPRGVLLVGEPGCGKTLLAKAIAGEADVPFFSISGSDFVEMFVGVGASRVRDLFKQAKDNAPCIIFLDEIDAVGRRRGANFGGGGHDEREQTLNAILVEMDGFDTSDQVIVIAATNRVDVLDPALIRPGRFDRQVYVPLPDVQGRYEILKVHARKIKLGPNVDLRRLARGTPMFSGADLAAIINEAALVATMAEKEYVEQDDLEESRDKVRWGRAKKSRVIDQKEKEVTAYHEAGHALVQALQKDADPLHKVSIIPRGPMGGATFSLPEKDRTIYTRSYLNAMLRVTFGGRIAEEIFCNDISSGASGDIRQATEIAKRMVKEWGMNEQVGFVYYGEDDKRASWFDVGAGREYSESTAELIDREIKRILDDAYHATKQLMLENREKVESLARALMKYETITGEEVHALIRGESLERPTVGDLLDAEQRERKVGLARPVSAEPKASPNIGGGPLPQPG